MDRFAAAVILLAWSVAAASEPGRDSHGDPLPEGAITRLGTVRFRDVEANFLAVTPDGKTIVTQSNRGPIQFWDAGTGVHRRTMPRPFTHDSMLSADGTTALEFRPSVGLRFWDVATGKERRTIKMPDFQPLETVSFALAPDGRTAFVGGTQLHVLNATTGTAVASAGEPVESIGQISSSPDGKRIATLSRRGTWIHSWAPGTDAVECLASLDSLSAGCVVVSPDGRWIVAVARRPGVRRHLLEASRLVPVEELTLPSIEGMESDDHLCAPVFSPDSKILVLGEPHRVIVWDVQKNKARFILPAGARYLAVSPDGKAIVTLRGVMQKWDIETGQPLFADSAAWGHTQPVTRLAWSRDGKQLVSGSYGDTSVYCWDTVTNRLLARTAGVHRGVQAVGFMRSGDAVSVTARDGIGIWDVRTGMLKHQIATTEEDETGFNYAAGLSPDGTVVIAHGCTISTRTMPILQAFDLATGKRIVRRTTPYPGWATKTVDGSTLIQSGGRRFDLATDRRLPLLEPPNGFEPWNRIDSAPGGAFVVGAVSDGKSHGVAVGDALTGKPLWHELGGEPQAFAVSPDGRAVAVYRNHQLQLFDVVQNQKYRTFSLVPDIQTMAFSPDGTRLATALSDSTIVLWDASRKVNARPIAAGDRESLWTALGDDQATVSVSAVWRWFDGAPGSLPWLRERITATATPPENMATLIASLGSPQFAIREKADVRLRELGGWIEPALQTALTAGPVPEARRRIEAIIADITEIPAPRGEELRRVRLVQVLERRHEPEAKELLQRIAKESDTRPATWSARIALSKMLP